jgi:hypothetical protein
MDNLGFMIFIVSMSIIGFLILREVVCWYFKINERLSTMNKVLDELVAMNKANKSMHATDLSSAHGAKFKAQKDLP